MIIYETYNPGSIVRILAFPADFQQVGGRFWGTAPTAVLAHSCFCVSNHQQISRGMLTQNVSGWQVLWQGAPQHAHLAKDSRAFVPPLPQPTFATHLVRIEFDSFGMALEDVSGEPADNFSLPHFLFSFPGLDYYAELDAVEFIGRGVRQLEERRWMEQSFIYATESSMYDPVDQTQAANGPPIVPAPSSADPGAEALEAVPGSEPARSNLRPQDVSASQPARGLFFFSILFFLRMSTGFFLQCPPHL